MTIKVYNDGNEVFHGPLSQFLADNDNDEWLMEECSKLEGVNQVEFSDMHSGDWRIEKI
jgi:hypothetical protein